MATAWLTTLTALVHKKPLVLIRFDEDEWEGLKQSQRGVNEFTIARSHSLLEGIKPPAPCLVRGRDDDGEHLYFGLVSSRSAITTLETRIKVRRAVAIAPETESALKVLIATKPHQRNLRKRLRSHASVVPLSPGLSAEIVAQLATIRSNRGAMRAVAESLSAPKYYRRAASLQHDAVYIALKAFGLGSSDKATSLELVEGRGTALARVSHHRGFRHRARREICAWL